MSVGVRPYRRADREQLTDLVTAHAAAVVPGVSVSVNTVLSQLEREPDEYIVDPWVAQRHTLVAVEADGVVAGALLLRYRDDDGVGEAFRDAGEIHWLVARPDKPAAADALLTACHDVLDQWQVRRRYADGSLPALATYGVPACWPHIRDAYRRAGFVFDGQIEVILVAAIDDLPRGDGPADDRLQAVRSVGDCGTRWSALLDGGVVGFVEVETDKTKGGVRSRLAGWADVGNLYVDPEHRRQGVGTWLVGHAAQWLRLGQVQRVLAYSWPEQHDELGFLTAVGFRELTRTERGWSVHATG